MQDGIFLVQQMSGGSNVWHSVKPQSDSSKAGSMI